MSGWSILSEKSWIYMFVQGICITKKNNMTLFHCNIRLSYCVKHENARIYKLFLVNGNIAKYCITMELWKREFILGNCASIFILFGTQICKSTKIIGKLYINAQYWQEEHIEILLCLPSALNFNNLDESLPAMSPNCFLYFYEDNPMYWINES